MNDHKKFKALLDEAGLSREDFANEMGMIWDISKRLSN